MLTTRPLPYDANASIITTALSEDLNLSAAAVEVDCCDQQLGRKWTIEFYSGTQGGLWKLNKAVTETLP